MDRAATPYSVGRAVLVEKPTRVNQRGICELLLHTWAPGVSLEYRIAA